MSKWPQRPMTTRERIVLTIDANGSETDGGNEEVVFGV